MASPSTAQVARYQTLQDGIDNVTLSSAPMPTPGPNEVLVKISAVSLNYRDTEVVQGLYTYYDKPGTPIVPLVPTSDICGVVVAIGAQSDGDNAPTWKIGDRPLDGVLQTYRVFPNTGLVRAPAYMTDEEASCLPIAAVTAWMAINGMERDGAVRGRGETMVLQGIGGVSVSGLQIAKAAGAKVIIMSSSDEKLEKAKALGADDVINYWTNPDWQDEVMKITDGKGADVILETGGAETLYKSLDCIGFGGLISCIGYVSGGEDKPNVSKPNLNVLALRRTVTLKGVINGPRDRFEEMCRFYEQQQIRPVVGRVFPFGEAKEAIKYVVSGSHFGKVVIKVE
ncbi:hypothetical protein B0T16DRAFT_432279 [Cercophora newfieldiana]|uniref:Enoyl reductase (ER) domain-containing protein n=1 Tax=Cercophora newfieldiana TaxID=92897 RepID=A0AA39XUR6_9PEZI|nr:hypothetical protein B0T16DRAFT_432279 [Cercophora newfieldiana]